jgi:pimeloyl-ACP methyl ester carboxylesterase
VRVDSRATLQSRRLEVRGRQLPYAVAGDGPSVIFMHGWALTSRTYRRALVGLAGIGVRVYAPALPGFGGTPDLPRDEQSFAGYAAWVADFVAALGLDGPVMALGHSFGGGVAIQLAHDSPALVSRLVVVNSVGGSAWDSGGGVLRSLAERPLWDWGLHLQADIWPIRQAYRVVPIILADAIPNLVRNPRGLWRVSRIASRANLTDQLEELRRRGLPVVVLWGAQDRVIPPASLAAVRQALGDAPCVTVEGKHSWLIANPSAFVEVMTNVIVQGAQNGDDAVA